MKKIITLLFLLYSMASYAQDLEKMIAKRDSIFFSNLGKQYPAFSTKTLNDETVTEQSLQGKVTLLNFWFTGCAPCVAEFEFLNRLYEKYKEHPNIQLITITKDEPELATQTVEEYNLKYPVCPVAVKESYRLNLNTGFPTNIIINKTGKIIYLQHGGSTDKAKAEEQVREFEQKMLEALNVK